MAFHYQSRKTDCKSGTDIFLLSVGPKYLRHSLFILINIHGATQMERGLVFGETDGILGVHLSTLAGIASIQCDLRGH